MTVAELIQILQKVVDKTLPVAVMTTHYRKTYLKGGMNLYFEEYENRYVPPSDFGTQVVCLDLDLDPEPHKRASYYEGY